MNPTEVVKRILTLAILFAVVDIAFSQPDYPQSNIPTNIPVILQYNLNQLYSGDGEVRGYAAYKLGEMGKDGAVAVPFLKEMLDDDVSLEWHEISALYGDETTPGREAARALVKIEGTNIVDFFAGKLDENVPDDTRNNIASALAETKDPRSVGILIAELNRHPSYDASAFISALAKFKDPRVVGVLCDELKQRCSTSDEDDAIVAADALRKKGDRRALEPLTFAFQNGGEQLRIHAALGLFVMGVTNVSVLVYCEEYASLSDTRRLKKKVAAMLDGMGTEAVEPLIQLLKDDNAKIRIAAARRLGDLKDSKALEPLAVCLNDENESVIEAAIKALAKIGDAKALQPLNECLEACQKDPDKQAFHGGEIIDLLNDSIQQIQTK